MKSLDRQERLDAAIEQIRFRFGKDAIKNGVLFQKSKMPTERKVDLVMPTGMIGLDRQERLDAAIEQIRFRFGKDAIKNGVLFQKSKMPTERKVDLVMPTGLIG